MDQKQAEAGKQRAPHQLILAERKRLAVSGIEQVDCFDENQVVLYTVMGRLEIRGENLHILDLSTEGGDFTLEGKVSALYYTDEEPGGGLFSFFRRSGK